MIEQMLSMQQQIDRLKLRTRAGSEDNNIVVYNRFRLTETNFVLPFVGLLFPLCSALLKVETALSQSSTYPHNEVQVVSNPFPDTTAARTLRVMLAAKFSSVDSPTDGS